MRKLVLTLVLVLTAAGGAVTGSGRSHPSTVAEFLCVFPKTVTVSDHSVSTPTVCLPAPLPLQTQVGRPL